MLFDGAGPVQKQKPLNDKDAYWALIDASPEQRLRYEEIQSKRRCKSKLTREDIVFEKYVRSSGRQKAIERADAAFHRLFIDKAE
jgi:hypothetical protein